METVISWIFISGATIIACSAWISMRRSTVDLNDRIDHCQTTLDREISKEIDARSKRAITDK